MIRAGLQIPNFTYPDVAPEDLFETIATVAVTAERSGFDTMMVMDHFYQLAMLGSRTSPCSRRTRSSARWRPAPSGCKLGTLVTGVTYRNPAMLAKIVTTLDVISKGRAFLGIGAAWFELEHEALGVEFPPVAERFERLEEAILIYPGDVPRRAPDDRGPPLPGQGRPQQPGPDPGRAARRC